MRTMLLFTSFSAFTYSIHTTPVRNLGVPQMWTARWVRERRQMAVTNSETLPEKPSLSSLPVPTVQRDHKGRNCEAAKKTLHPRTMWAGFVSSRDQYNGPVPLHLRSQAPEKMHIFSTPNCSFPTIYFHGWTLEERQYWQFIHPLPCLCSDAKG